MLLRCVRPGSSAGPRRIAHSGVLLAFDVAPTRWCCTKVCHLWQRLCLGSLCSPPIASWQNAGSFGNRCTHLRYRQLSRGKPHRLHHRGPRFLLAWSSTWEASPARCSQHTDRRTILLLGRPLCTIHCFYDTICLPGLCPHPRAPLQFHCLRWLGSPTPASTKPSSQRSSCCCAFAS